MNIKKVINYIGNMLRLEAILLLFPFVCGLIYKEHNAFYFIVVSIFLFVLGTLLSKIFVTDNRFYSAEGFLTVAIGWILLSFFGAMPFVLSGEIPNIIDAMFETVSGFTTTGATILSNVTLLSKCMNFWRCLTHFVGGMGVLVLMIAFIPTRSENMHILRAESPGPQVGKLLPKVSETAKILYIIYVSLTCLMIICYFISGMPLYDSICIGFGTAGTGGFVVTANGCADYNSISQLLIAIFMFLFGINFNLYYLLLLKEFKVAIKSEEFRIYFLIVIFSVAIIVMNTLNMFGNIFDALHYSFFQVSSIITTTGFSTNDYTNWPMLSQNILLLLMIIGGCAGSTAGGFKVSRCIILIKCAINEIYLQLHPNSVKVIKLEDKVLSNETVRTVNCYMIIYFLFILLGVCLISVENFDFMTTFSSVIETFNNVGLGMSKIGPKGNFSIFSYFSKIIFIILMLTGRLEIFPMIMIFSKKTWRREQ